MATAPTRGTATGDRSPAQLFALVFGVVYLLIGLVGFAATGLDNFATFSNDSLLIFNINPLHNLVHLAIGGVWIAASKNHASAKSANLGIGVVYLLVAVLGLLKVEFVAELLNINEGEGDPDNFLHLISGAAGVFFGTAGAEGAGTRATTA